MINLLLFLFFVACISFVAVLIVENPGNIMMIWFNYQIETSAAFILFVTIVAFILIILFAFLARNIIFSPARFLQRRNIKQLKSGITELTHSVAALASSNVDAAEIHVRKVEKLLGRTPLTLMLSAQIAKTRGDEGASHALLSQLLEYKETEYLATRSLGENASKQGNLPKALQLAKKAQEINPKDSSAGVAIVSIQIRLKQWDEALIALQKARLPRRERMRIHALIQLVRGEFLLADGRDEEALVAARNAISILPNFIPAIVLAARAYSKNEMSGKAIRLIKRAWKNNHAALLIEVMSEVIRHEPAERQKKILSALSGNVNDGIWECKACGHNQKIWESHCSSCSGFDSFEWK
ncbi:MAG: heme biosynthesis HemY N-terminal domain-containing protein [Rickettsiales bacterium]